MTRMIFYTTEKLSGKMSRTPEGFLLCLDVPIARTGMMLYGPEETPIKAGPDELVKIFREDSEVFRPATIASAQGKSVTNDHPDEDVNLDNWRNLTIGTVFNARRGAGAQDDLLLADFLITTNEGLDEIESGKREVSCGYTADYEETGPGMGVQRNIIINHVALVESGRCGSRCSISDSKPTTKEKPMAKKHNRIADAIADGLKKAVAMGAGRTGDEDIPAAPEEGDVHVHVHGNEDDELENGAEGRARFTDDDIQEHIDQNAAEHEEMRSRIEALENLVAQLAGNGGDEDDLSEDEEMEKQLSEEAPSDIGDEEMEQVVKAKDSRYLGESFKDTVAMAEILAPGIPLPTFDSAAKPKQTFKKICSFRRQALDKAYAKADSHLVIHEILGGRTLDTKNMTCDAVRTLFRAAASAKKLANNAGINASVNAKDMKSTAAVSLAELNKRNAAYWDRH